MGVFVNGIYKPLHRFTIVKTYIYQYNLAHNKNSLKDFQTFNSIIF